MARIANAEMGVEVAGITRCAQGSTGRLIRYFPRRVLSSVVDTHRRTIVPELLGSWPLGLGL
jgi:hypothetical protein